MDIACYLGPSYIAGVIYSGGGILSLALSIETIPEAFLPLMEYALSTDANVIARFAPTFVDGCGADPAVLPWVVKLQWMGAFAAQPPEVRSWSFNRAQDVTKWQKEARGWPVLLIQGASDTHCRADVLVKQAKDAYTDVTVHVLEGVGHSPHLERADTVNRLLLQFIEAKRQ